VEGDELGLSLYLLFSGKREEDEVINDSLSLTTKEDMSCFLVTV
jgi:hypothetical protein